MNTIEEKVELFKNVTRVIPNSLKEWKISQEDYLSTKVRISTQVQQNHRITVCIYLWYDGESTFIVCENGTVSDFDCFCPSFGLTKLFNKPKYEEIKKERDLYNLIVSYLFDVVNAVKVRNSNVKAENTKKLIELFDKMVPVVEE